MTLPLAYVTRHLPQPALDFLAQHTHMSWWPDELPPPHDRLLAEASNVDGLLALLTDRIDAEFLDAAPRLRIVSNYAVGYDNIDLRAATERGVLVTNTPDVLTETTADFTFALMFAAARRIVDGVNYVKDGQWKTWGPEILLGQDMYGATLGIIGVGRIGSAVAKRAHGFGMRILYSDERRKPDLETAYGLEHVTMDQLFAQSDIISLHCPLNDKTRHLIDRAALERLKSTAIVVNTARGAVIDTAALIEVLRHKPIVAALDVTDPEPLPADHPLLSLPNVLVTPHIASATVATRTRMAMVAAKNLVAGLQGQRPPFLLNPDAWERFIAREPRT